jgi:hypothetical protein
MSRNPYDEDPIAYRIDYSRIAQSLHLESVTAEAAPGVGAEKKPTPKDPKSPAKKPAPKKPAPDVAAVARVVEKLIGPNPPPPDDAVKEALALVLRARRELYHLGWKWVGWTPRWTWREVVGRLRHPIHGTEIRRLATFLDQILEPATVVLYFSARIAKSELAALPSRDSSGRLKRGPFDLPGGAGASRRDESAWTDRYLQILLCERKDGRPGIPMKWKPSAAVNYRVRYNLACMYSRLGEVPQSLDQLRQAVTLAKGRDRQALVEWAKKDPALTAARHAPKDGFAEALSAAAAADEAPR